MADLCKCDRPDIWARTLEGPLVCLSCGKPPECEFSYLEDDPHPAETTHLDYVVCWKHLNIAVNNVHGRTMP